MAGVFGEDELVSPRRAAAVARMLKSPVGASGGVHQTALHVLGSNDDQLERAQARAARAAAIRRNPVAPAAQIVDSNMKSDVLGKEQITELFRNCIKLASENKINQKNTWELNLIDHLSEIIMVESDDDAETNFQKASCTLEAGVKIYSMRVDSVHSEAYKVLGGINRAGKGDDKENSAEGDVAADSQEGFQKKEADRKVSPLSTLESSFDALNVKKFDVAFTVDPLYHQTSAKIDEGGAKGLLLNSLGIYGVCEVLFDSLETPSNIMSQKCDGDALDCIDLSFVRDHITEMMASLDAKKEISPTLREIVGLLDDNNRWPTDTSQATQRSEDQDQSAGTNESCLDGDGTSFETNPDRTQVEENMFEGNLVGDYEPCGFDHDENGSIVDECPSYMTENFHGDPEVSNTYTKLEQDTESSFDDISGFLALGLGFGPKTNAWAGPEHWRYRKIKAPDDIPASDLESSVIKSKARKKKQEACDITFTAALDEEISDIFDPPKSRRSIMLPRNRVPCSTTLPEDCHYLAQNLVKLLLRPDLLCLGKRQRKFSSETMQRSQPFESGASWDNESVADGYHGYDDNEAQDENGHSDQEGPGSLVSKPRLVKKIEVQYDKSSKQVDVHALKQTLWSIIVESNGPADTAAEEVAEEAVVSFRQVLNRFSAAAGEGGAANDVSPHLSFICLLHLANEHGLILNGSPALDQLDIRLPLRPDAAG
ncbi:condensin complex subunit [Wolffia australiana]